MCGVSEPLLTGTATGGSHRKCSKQPLRRTRPMAENLSMALAELLRKADAEPDMDTLREGVRVMTQALMELEVAQHLGAERYQRSPDRQGERNGYRDRNWDARVGTLELRVPTAGELSSWAGIGDRPGL